MRFLALRTATIAVAVVATGMAAVPAAVASTQPDGSPALARTHDGERSLRDLARGRLAIGTAVGMDALDKDPAYRRLVGGQFSAVTPENVMKWEVVEPTRDTYDWSQGDQLVDFARANHQQVRGHTLVWHSQLPEWLTEGTFTNDELRTILKKHVTDQATHFRGRIWQWDVVNEAFNEDGTMRDTLWLRQLGPGYVADAFRWAHRADPKATLFYNDYTIEGLNPKSDAAYAMVRQLRSEGVPIGGIGLQAHLGTQYEFPTGYVQNLQRFADLGVKISVTEADVRMPLPVDATKLQVQSDAFTDLLRGCLAVRACTDFTMWGFTDKYSWIPGVFPGQGSAHPLDELYQPKPAWDALKIVLADDHQDRPGLVWADSRGGVS